MLLIFNRLQNHIIQPLSLNMESYELELFVGRK